MLRAQESRPSVQEQRTDLLLWISVLLGPLAMGVNTVVGYTVAHWVCDVNHKRMSFLVSAVDFLLCICAFLLAFTLSSNLPDAEDSLPELGRRNFMAKFGMLLSALSALLVIAGTIAAIILSPCD
jgi:hypothetical protein